MGSSLGSLEVQVTGVDSGLEGVGVALESGGRYRYFCHLIGKRGLECEKECEGEE